MKRCGHTRWLSICARSGSGSSALVQSDRPAALVKDLPSPDAQQPCVFVLVGSAEKSVALQASFGIKKARWPLINQTRSEMHLHLDPSTIFADRPILLASYNVRPRPASWITARRDPCHRETRHPLRQPSAGVEAADDILPRLLFPFADVFCLFSDDLGGFRQIAQRLAFWLDQNRSSTPPKTALPSVVVVTSRFPPKAGAEDQARRALLCMLEEETTVDPYQQLAAIDVVAVFPKGAMSAEARWRRLRERLMERSDQVRKDREARCALYSATHLAAFLQGAGAHFARAPDVPFDFLQAARIHNPVAPDLAEHLSNFLKHITSSTQLTEFAVPFLASTLLLDSYPPGAHGTRPSFRSLSLFLSRSLSLSLSFSLSLPPSQYLLANAGAVFDCRHVFDELYRPAFRQVSEARVAASEETDHVVLEGGLADLVVDHLVRYFEQLVGGEAAADIHRDNLARFQSRWHGIESSSTCLCCLRRRPQPPRLPCGHLVCENCVVVFGDRNDDDPWTFNIRHCFLCGQAPPSDVAVRVHPPTAGAGVLCIDGGGTRGIVPLVLMKRIQDRIGLPIPLQRFVKVAFGVSIGKPLAAVR